MILYLRYNHVPNSWLFARVAIAGDFDGPDVGFVQLLFARAAARQFQFDTLLQQRGGDDEDDEQHERQVQQRRDVDFTQRHEMTALAEASHD